jgi:hypothetical protein
MMTLWKAGLRQRSPALDAWKEFYTLVAGLKHRPVCPPREANAVLFLQRS